MVGYCATGSTAIETRPATTISSETTVAKIGRSMKNLENMRARPDGYFLAAAGAASFLPCSAGGFTAGVPAFAPGS